MLYAYSLSADALHDYFYFCLEKIKPSPLPKPNLLLTHSSDCNCNEAQKYAFNNFITY